MIIGVLPGVTLLFLDKSDQTPTNRTRKPTNLTTTNSTGSPEFANYDLYFPNYDPANFDISSSSDYDYR